MITNHSSPVRHDVNLNSVQTWTWGWDYDEDMKRDQYLFWEVLLSLKSGSDWSVLQGTKEPCLSSVPLKSREKCALVIFSYKFSWFKMCSESFTWLNEEYKVCSPNQVRKDRDANGSNIRLIVPCGIPLLDTRRLTDSTFQWLLFIVYAFYCFRWLRLLYTFYVICTVHFLSVFVLFLWTKLFFFLLYD